MLVDKDLEQNEGLVIHEEVVRELLLHLDVHTFRGLDGLQLLVLRQLAEVVAKLLFIIYQQSWLSGEVLLATSKCDGHLQEEPEGGLRELQACQFDLGAGETHGAA